jgi:hypothetical protein
LSVGFNGSASEMRTPGRLGSLRNSRLGNLRYIRWASWKRVNRGTTRECPHKLHFWQVMRRATTGLVNCKASIPNEFLASFPL